MTSAIGLLVVIAGLAASTRSSLLEARAADRRTISLWKPEPGYRRPLRSVLLQLLAVLIAGVGTIILTTGGSAYSMFLLPLVFVPPVAVAAVHNRRIRCTQAESKE